MYLFIALLLSYKLFQRSPFYNRPARQVIPAFVFTTATLYFAIWGLSTRASASALVACMSRPRNRIMFVSAWIVAYSILPAIVLPIVATVAIVYFYLYLQELTEALYQFTTN